MARGSNGSAHTNGVDWTSHEAACLEAGLYGPNLADCSPNGLNLHGLRANPWTRAQTNIALQSQTLSIWTISLSLFVCDFSHGPHQRPV